MGDALIKRDFSCRGCMFALPLESNIVGLWIAECRKNPPQMIFTSQGMMVIFPRVNETLFCFSREPIKKNE
jgi:hypothetical protein